LQDLDTPNAQNWSELLSQIKVAKSIETGDDVQQCWDFWVFAQPENKPGTTC
jgi:hypothetical protein